MKNRQLPYIYILFVVFFMQSMVLAASEKTDVQRTVKTVSSPPHRVALLELYTSEGCSSCPPADRFLSRLKDSGMREQQLIAMAFHVTYWDYIGWQDRFADIKFDQRQRAIAHKSTKNSIYTPQFLLAGKDYRQYAHFKAVINKLAVQKSTVDLTLSSQVIVNNTGEKTLQLNLSSDISKSRLDEIVFYFAMIENNLDSSVDSGENKGKRLHHDYVVRQLSKAYLRKKSGKQRIIKYNIFVNPEWKKQDLSIIAFAENPVTGEVLQAVKLNY